MESNALPLAGIKVIDLSRVLAGPFCTMLLSYLGAEVIKVENRKGDETRVWPPFTKDMSNSFLAVNLNKRGIVIDLNSGEGQGIVKDLVRGADVLVENFKTGAMEKFGLAYAELKKVNPGLVFCSISAFGRRGPRAAYPGYETLLQAYSGIMSFTGMPGGDPVRSGVSFLDLSSGIIGALSTVTALYRRDKGGEGALVEGSLLQSAVFLMALQLSNYFQSGMMPQKLGSAHASATPYQAFPTSDGHVLIAAANQNLWEKLALALGLEWMIPHEKFKDNRCRMDNQAEFLAHLSETTRKWETRPLIDALVEAGVPCSKFNDFDDLMADGQVDALGAVKQIDDPHYGSLRVSGLPFHMTGLPHQTPRRAPRLGEHTREILAELGYDASRIDSLIGKGVIYAG
ncbi:MAG: CoA transferase [SAR324 cluster bacterium]|nr:CoA transferase [SAR324 cluster bacterium]